MNANDAASMNGRVCLVTGATSGIGQETALALAGRGAHVVMAGRNPERAESARADVVARSGSERVETLLGDLSTLSGIAQLAAEFRKRHDALHLLVNNAGIVNMSREVNSDGFEMMFAVNHLAYFSLTHQLLDLLRASAPARVVNVSSEAHRFGTVDFEDLQSERAYKGLPLVAAMRVYGTSKLENLLFTFELARKLEGSGVTANAVHPGAVATRLGQNNGVLGRITTGLLRPFFRTPAQGAATSVRVATAPELAAVSGEYFLNERQSKASRAARDEADARRLWDVSLELCGLED
jgi:NAD(P)-dependent dehydrogenase (short-subunit alcohol dehydrogenase family)